MNPTTLLSLATAFLDARLAEAFVEFHKFDGGNYAGSIKGPRGGRYWIREGALDVEANRVYSDTNPSGSTGGGGFAAGLDKAARITAGVTAGGLLGSALGGPVGATVRATAGVALGTDTA
jgi:hypothetical protein